MEELNYRTNDRTFPDEPLQRLFAERFMDLMLPDMMPGKTVLEGLEFDHEGYLYVSADHKQITPVIESGLIKTNGIALSPDWKSLWFTEFASGTLNQIVFRHDGFAEKNMKTFTPYHFTGPEGPDTSAHAIWKPEKRHCTVPVYMLRHCPDLHSLSNET